MHNREEFQDITSVIFETADTVNSVNNYDEMDKPYKDGYTTEEQQKRDKNVTKLLELYVNGYEYKIDTNKLYKSIIFYICCSILVVFSIIFVVFVCVFMFNKKSVSISVLCQLISVCISFITLIIGILTIIVKYVFPENEEQYITRIVEIIQENDLENKKENIKVHNNSVVEENNNE